MNYYVGQKLRFKNPQDRYMYEDFITILELGTRFGGNEIVMEWTYKDNNREKVRVCWTRKDLDAELIVVDALKEFVRNKLSSMGITING